MRRTIITSLAATAMLIPISLSFAKTEYYIELGQKSDEEEAMQQWQSIVSANKDMLGHLQFHPETMLEPGNRVTTRIQAGPIDSKASAEKLCSHLFAKNVPCFVLEGQINTTRKAASVPPVALGQSPTASAQALPWTGQPTTHTETPTAAPTQPPANEAHSSGNGAFSWLFGNGDSKGASASSAPASGKVDVAEAIRVPLSNSEQGSVTQENLPVPASAPAPQTPPSAAAAENQEQPADYGWLNVDAFDSEESAADFWQSVRAAVPTQAAGLRVRIVRPLLASQTTVTMNIGPFPSINDANNFCRDGVVPVNHSLRCSFVAGEPSRVANAPELHYNPARDYNARRRLLLQQHSANTLASSPARPAVQGKLYWVQVATAASQLGALQRWKQIQENNADVLHDLGSRISTSMAGKMSYTVRVGPIKTNTDAFALCSALQQRSIDCKVFVYTGSW